MLKLKNKPRIRLETGGWYAHPGKGLAKAQANYLLFLAIRFCEQRNRTKERT